MNTPNKHRIIDIRWRGAPDNSSNRDWRCALSRLQSNFADNFIIDSSFLKTLDVDPRVYLLMSSSPKTMKTSNRIKEPVQELLKSNSNSIVGKTVSAINIASDVLNAVAISNSNGETTPTWQPWMMGVKSWDGTHQGFAFEYEFSFAMGQYGLWNAEEEVVKPILNLIAPALPRSMNNFSMNGPFPTAIQLLALLIKNLPDAIMDTFGGEGTTFQGMVDGFTNRMGEVVSNIAENGVMSGLTDIAGDVNNVLGVLSDTLSNVIQASYQNYTYDVSFGNFVTFNNMIITNGETSFSNEVDQFGYPIAGSVKLTFEGLVPLAMSYSNPELVAIKYGG